MRFALICLTGLLLAACGQSGPPPLTCADVANNLEQYVGRDVEFRGAWMENKIEADAQGHRSETNVYLCLDQAGSPISDQPFIVRGTPRKSAAAQAAEFAADERQEWTVRGRLSAVESQTIYVGSEQRSHPAAVIVNASLDVQVTPNDPSAPPVDQAAPADPPFEEPPAQPSP